MRTLHAMVVAAAVAGCSLDAAGLSTGADASVTDVATHREASVPHDASGNPDAAGADVRVLHPDDASPHDTGAHDRVAVPDAPPVACSVPPGPCVAALPAGWQLVTFASSQMQACPSPLTPLDVVSDPVAGAGACGCECDVTTPPVCNEGSLARTVSADGSCNQSGVVLSVDGAGCSPWAAGSSGLYAYGKASPLPATNGACTASATMNTGDVTTTPARVCTVPTNCEEQTCEGGAAAGFSVCIEQAGAQTSCPAGWGSPVVVGTSIDLSCSACSCDVNTLSTCTAASLAIFGDGACGTLLATVAVDGTCVADPAAGQTPVAFKYGATLNQVCATAGAKTATVALVSPETLCCKP